MHRYQLYGSHVQSSHRLTGLNADSANTEPDLFVNWVGQRPIDEMVRREWKPVMSPELSRRRRINLWQASEVNGEGNYLRLQIVEEAGNLEFIFNPQLSALSVYWPSGLSFLDVQTYFIGTVMGGLLRRRGQLCLHASVVASGEHAVAFIGPKRAGKSTTAAAFVRTGWSLLADDIAALSFEGEVIWVQSGYPRLRLDTDAVSLLRNTAEGLPWVLGSDYGKHYVDIATSDSVATACKERALPLAAIYVLHDRSTDSPRVTDLPPQERLMSLVLNTIGTYMVIGESMKRHELKQLNQLVQKVPVRRLQVPDGIDDLPQLCKLVLSDLQAIKD